MAKRKNDFLDQDFNFKDAIPIKGRVPSQSEMQNLIKEKKLAKFTARLAQTDFLQLKKIANKKGIGYQTLLGQVIHDYVNGNLANVDEIRKVFRDFKIKS